MTKKSLAGPPHLPTKQNLSLAKSPMLRGVLLAVLLALLSTFYFRPSSFSGLPYLGQPCELPNLYSATLEDIASGLQNGHFTSQDLVRAYLARIAEVQDEFHAVIETNPHALAEAKLLDAARRGSKTPPGPFYGIPVLIKDNIATARPDQTYMNTTAGSYALLGSIPARESTVAAKLKESGAIILGKANLREWSGWRDRSMPINWSARGGGVTGAYVKNQNPWASSSGSAVSGALGLSLATLGTETNGSIIMPSQNGNLCGIKPSTGLVSRSMVIPISTTQDTAGPMAPDCKTAASLLTVIAGKDLAHDPATGSIPFDTIPDYAKACTKHGLKGARIGIPNAFIAARDDDVDDVVSLAFNRTFKVMENLGATIIEHADFPDLEAYLPNRAGEIIMSAEFVQGLKDYLEQLYYNPNNITDLKDLIEYTKNDPREEYQNYGSETWHQCLAGGLTLDSAEYKRARAKHAWLGSSATLVGALEKYGLDALIVPTLIAANVASLANHPVITVPLGFYPEGTPVVYYKDGPFIDKAPNVPFGISFIGRRFSEEKLVAYACAFEAATQVRNKGPLPYLLPRTGLRDVIARTQV